MTENPCPECGEPIPAQSINIEEGAALCPSCGRLSRLSEVVERQPPMLQTLDRPPKGCEILHLGREFLVRASLRSLPGFAGSLFFALFWNGITSVFVLIALAGLYTNLIGPLPAWFPAPNMDDDMTLGMTLFLCAFLTPFVLIGMTMIGVVLLNIVGRVEVRISESEGVVRTGVGFLTWNRRFDPSQVRHVETGVTPWETNGRHSPLIVIKADRHIKFGSLLREERREWLQSVLRAILASGSENRERLFQIIRRNDPRFS